MSNCTIIANSIPWSLLGENVRNYVPVEMKIHLTSIKRNLETSIEDKIKFPSLKWIKNSLIVVEACLDKTWEILNSGHWQFVPVEYRYCYTLCTILKTVLLELQYSNSSKQFTKNTSLLKNIIQQIDKGILLGAPLPNVTDLLPKLASELNIYVTESLELDLEELIIDSKNLYKSILPGFTEIVQYVIPSMELFYKEIFMPKVPALMKDCIKHWKALKRWKNLKYLLSVAGNRIIPIEIGSRYTDENWSQQLLSFSEFLQKYVLTECDQVGYLAQHQLFEQIPELKDDFTVPEYCNFTDSNNVEQPDINAWFGPSGTVSPLHFDSKNNFLCQVFGYKRVILYHPSDSSNLYSYDTKLLNNTAQVDPLNPDFEKWPNFSKAKGFMVYLKPGEILYIPPKWWHHVTSLTPSFSISFWWT